MTEEILINVTPREARVGVVENGMLQEVHIERTGHRGYVGNIYCGRVKRVMPGMQAAFIDVGLERSAFLHAADMAHPTLSVDPIEGAASASANVPAITELVHEGQRVIVQVIKDPISSKGARLSTHLSIPSRYLVLLPDSATLGVSVRIEDEVERERLRGILTGLAGNGYGLIARTNAEGLDAMVLAEDVDYVTRVWQTVSEAIARAQPGERVYEEPPLPLRVLRDLMHDEIEKVRVDSHETWERTLDFARQFMPDLTGRVEHYPGERPIFDLYGVEDEIQKALRKEVPLKSGGYLVIDQTEAMTTIDVNTGGYLGTRNLEETVYRTNLEAAQASARQLRLRNLGGIIIIDFIDMTEEEHRRQVLQALTGRLAGDHA
ncbi:MAG: Rne/Rng family ribonuclease, partial [Rhodanobacteraceae bacterium]